ncbi:hypothetical protein HMPREF3198_01218 [Winkia neuii]|nr:hypothetical protein HMPREF3198_01218 [Winkia neuii]
MFCLFWPAMEMNVFSAANMNVGIGAAPCVLDISCRVLRDLRGCRLFVFLFRGGNISVYLSMTVLYSTAPNVPCLARVSGV